MPNWCYNFATIICPSREIYNKLLISIAENNWFETFAPLSIDTNNNENTWGYHKAIETWNTKWDVVDVNILNQDDDDLILEVSFQTAWSPPTGVYNIMNKKYDIDITAFYDEEGCEFFGKCIYSKEEEFDETYDFPSDKKELQELRKIIGSELDDFMSSTWEQLEEQWNEEDEEDEEDEEIDGDQDEENIIKDENNEIMSWEW
jgi:hypothetical protein